MKRYVHVPPGSYVLSVPMLFLILSISYKFMYELEFSVLLTDSTQQEIVWDLGLTW